MFDDNVMSQIMAFADLETLAALAAASVQMRNLLTHPSIILAAIVRGGHASKTVQLMLTCVFELQTVYLPSPTRLLTLCVNRTCENPDCVNRVNHVRPHFGLLLCWECLCSGNHKLFADDPFLQANRVARQTYRCSSFLRGAPFVDTAGEHAGPVVCHLHRFLPTMETVWQTLYPHLTGNYLTQNNPTWTPEKTEAVWEALQNGINIRAGIHRGRWIQMVKRRRTKRNRIRFVLKQILYFVQAKTKFKADRSWDKLFQIKRLPVRSLETVPNFVSLNLRFSTESKRIRGPVIAFRYKMMTSIMKQVTNAPAGITDTDIVLIGNLLIKRHQAMLNSLNRKPVFRFRGTH